MTSGQELFNILSGMTAAFWGAFFAFIFGLFSLLLIKRWERFVLHRNAVVKLTYLLNEYIDRIVINKNLLQSSQEFLKKGKLTYNRFLDLKIDEGLDLEFEDLILINRYFWFKLGVFRINKDLQFFNYALTRFEDVLIHGQQLNKENLDRIDSNMSHFVTMLSDFEDETKKLLVFSRVHLRKIKNWNLFTFPLAQAWKVNMKDQEIDKELVLLNQEIDENEQQT